MATIDTSAATIKNSGTVMDISKNTTIQAASTSAVILDITLAA